MRKGASVEGLRKLKTVFKAEAEGGASTAGNSSQVSDSATGVVLKRRQVAEGLGLGDLMLAKFVAATTAGYAPDEMGIGPALAISKFLNRIGLRTEDVKRWEINEAFASQSVFCLRELGLVGAWEKEKVKPIGRAIALGHPLGAMGARMVTTPMHEMRRDGDEVGVVSMCVGTGMGMAALFVAH